jgi:hypothetical protein
MSDYSKDSRDSRTSSQMTGRKSTKSIDSGNVTQNMRMFNRIEADAACKHAIVKIQDSHGRTIKKKLKTEKMNKVQTFFALCKCYCAINVLLTPKAFKNGGYMFSPISLFIAAGL